MKIIYSALFIFFLATQSALADSNITFTDVTKAAGITFLNQSSKEKKYIVESMGGGTAFFDY